jgi:hypothetical protein
MVLCQDYSPVAGFCIGCVESLGSVFFSFTNINTNFTCSQLLS